MSKGQPSQQWRAVGASPGQAAGGSRSADGGTRKKWWVKRDGAKDGARTPAFKPGGKPDRDLPSLAEFRAHWPDDAPDEASDSNRDYYFNSYAGIGIHEDMLRDQTRTGSYMKAIKGNAHLFAGKTVLDVGSGTGILCLFAAKAGAKRCIGIECSDIAEWATRIAADNGYADVITYVKGKVEEVELPIDEVDIIVSEWMGYFLIYESMLDSVLFARDKWLRKGGLLFPDHARLYMAGIEDADYREEKLGFWRHAWGLDFSPMEPMVIEEPISDVVYDTAIATSTACVLELDLTTCRRKDLDFVVPYTIRATRKDFLHALVVWFDVSFRACSPPVVLSTAPGLPTTHWKQCVLYLEKPIVAHEGEVISGLLAARKNGQNHRDLDIRVSIALAAGAKVAYPERVQQFRLR